MKRIIYYLPFKLNRNLHSASQIRPLKMLKAFQDLGYEVEFIEGESIIRKQQLKKLRKKICLGVKYDFLYSESSTEPTLLTDSHHLPLHPFFDFSFFSFVKKKGIPIGVFYRDIYWNTDYMRGWKLRIAKLFYKYDLFQYNKYVSTIFLPSLEMCSYIPYKLNVNYVSLPPGLDIIPINKKNPLKKSRINILYIGGIDDSGYDMELVMNVISRFPLLKLTVCCRIEEWNSYYNKYKKHLASNIEIVHKSGRDLHELYENADFFSILIKPTKYWDFAVPFKLFEALGFMCPILSVKGSWVGNFVTENNLGWAIDYDEKSINSLFQNLIINMGEQNSIYNSLRKSQLDNTWVCRAKSVMENLLKEYGY